MRHIYTIACIVVSFGHLKMTGYASKKLSDFFRHFPHRIVSHLILLSYSPKKLVWFPFSFFYSIRISLNSLFTILAYQVYQLLNELYQKYPD